jgi:hypothetical protein
VLRSWPAVFWDGHDRVTGFWGLALPGMPHRIRRAGTDLSAWCAWDPLFLAQVIGDLEVATADPVTGEAITYRISGDGAVAGASHPAAVLSFLRPDQPWDDDVMTTFCHYVLHFTSPATAAQWTAARPGTFAISLGGGTGPPPRSPVLLRRAGMNGADGPRRRWPASSRPAGDAGRPCAGRFLVAGPSAGECALVKSGTTRFDDVRFSRMRQDQCDRAGDRRARQRLHERDLPLDGVGIP